MYTWDGGDKRIKYANISALEYNPEGAFDIVNPSKDVSIEILKHIYIFCNKGKKKGRGKV